VLVFLLIQGDTDKQGENWTGQHSLSNYPNSCVLPLALLLHVVSRISILLFLFTYTRLLSHIDQAYFSFLSFSTVVVAAAAAAGQKESPSPLSDCRL
jgi:hypothetical protein